ncbi:MAG: alpha/beta fold hydrolase [Acidobacteriota bacterium]
MAREVRSAVMSLRGHVYTVAPRLRDALRRSPAPPGAPWHTAIAEDGRELRITGCLRELAGASTIVVIVHGLGGRADSDYCLRDAAAAERAGCSSLCVALRGADRRGEDIYHAGLTADVDAAIQSGELSAYRRIVLLGYSLGGHTVLHAALRPVDRRIAAVAAVCAPLDLAAAQRFIDTEALAIYRLAILHGLKAIYAEVARRRAVPTPPRAVRRIRTLYEWDRLTVVPRFGFGTPERYYAETSVGPRLPSLRTPALVVASEGDPLVPLGAVRPHADAARATVRTAYVATGGHVGFPRSADLGIPGERGLEPQIVAWLLAPS